MAVIILGLVVLVVGWWIVKYRQATRIARRHSYRLSQITGIPPDVIYQEMKQNNLTPGEWAARHGLDPLTFEPRQ